MFLGYRILQDITNWRDKLEKEIDTKKGLLTAINLFQIGIWNMSQSQTLHVWFGNYIETDSVTLNTEIP